jgi:hypothetical protein
LLPAALEGRQSVISPTLRATLAEATTAHGPGEGVAKSIAKMMGFAPARKKFRKKNNNNNGMKNERRTVYL